MSVIQRWMLRALRAEVRASRAEKRARLAEAAAVAAMKKLSDDELLELRKEMAEGESGDDTERDSG